MDDISIKAMNMALDHGPLGLALIICLLAMWFSLTMAFMYNSYKTKNIQSRLEETRQDKIQLMDLVRSNTHAIDKNTSALENNTLTVRTCVDLIHRILEPRF